MAISTPLWIQKADDLDPDIEYTGQADRQLIRAMFAEGILSGGAVSERGAGANFTVDVAVFSAVVDGDDETDQGAYLVWSDAVENVAVSAAPGSDSRIDLVVLEVNDEQAGGTAGVALGRVRVLAGTPAGSPSAPATPDTAIALATIGPITPATTSITNGLITDVRPLARLRHQVVDTDQLVDGAVETAKIVDGAVTPLKVTGARGVMGYAQRTSNQNTITSVIDIASVTVTFTAVAGRRYRATASAAAQMPAGGPAIVSLSIRSGSTVLNDDTRSYVDAGEQARHTAIYVNNGSISGSTTWKMSLASVGATSNLLASATSPAFILVEDIGAL